MDDNAKTLQAAMNSAIEDNTNLPSDLVEGDDLNQAVMDSLQQVVASQDAGDAKYEAMPSEGGKKLGDAAGKAASGVGSLVKFILDLVLKKG